MESNDTPSSPPSFRNQIRTEDYEPIPKGLYLLFIPVNGVNQPDGDLLASSVDNFRKLLGCLFSVVHREYKFRRMAFSPGVYCVSVREK